MRKSILYSQNFIRNRSLVAGLVERSSITKDDAVYEIGAGTGLITGELLKRAGKVVAFEIDPNLFSKLTAKFASSNNLILRNADFLEQNLPVKPYKVFSNIPFNITAQVIKKLTQSVNPPLDSYLIVQKEAAEKFTGKPEGPKNSQISALIKPWFEMKIVHHFKRDDFSPRPNVDIVLLRIKKRENPLVSYKDKRKYEDFVVYAFNQTKPNITEGMSGIFGKQVIERLSGQLKFSSKAKPSEIEFDAWMGLFNHLLNKLDKAHQAIIEGWADRLRRQEQKIKKIHRTRVDGNWQAA